ncbi:signal sequence binding protein [Mycena epipterygia]|nr:signal sequence binding protein [Mycena epipterygia]
MIFLRRNLFDTFLFLLCLPLVLGQTPEHTVTSLRDLPTNLFFFPNSTSAVSYNIQERTLYISHDTGRSWWRLQSMPIGLIDTVILHPFNPGWAFVITRPRDVTVAQTHYRTEDSGSTWIAFELPASPARFEMSLSFHSDPENFGHILYQSIVCNTPDRNRICHGETYITKDAFRSPPRRILTNTIRCQFAHSNADFTPDVHSDLVYCIEGQHGSTSARLYSSTDFFESEKQVEELCVGKNAQGFITSPTLTVFATSSSFAVFALEINEETVLCVTKDAKTWTKAELPVRFRRQNYALVPAGHALGIDVCTNQQRALGTLFVSDASGSWFVESLRDTNWSNARWLNRVGMIDSEAISGVPGITIVNVVANAADVVGRGAEKQLRTLITYDDGRSWSPIAYVNATDAARGCDPADVATCSLHLYPRPVSKTLSFSPGVVVGVGSIGKVHLPYKESDTFLSTDAGITWTMLAPGAFIYEFADAGGILVMIGNEGPVSEVQYSSNLGQSWQTYDFGLMLNALDLIPVPEVGSQKFILFGERSPVVWARRYVLVYLDFANTRKDQCTEEDFEKWYARPPGAEICLMGSKQPYKRRKPQSDCYVGGAVTGALAPEESCPCSDADYECDYNFVRDGVACVAAVPEVIPPGVCSSAHDMYMGSSGYRKIPGNTCTGGSKDAQVQKSCHLEKPADGSIVLQTFEFPSKIVQHQYFKDSTTILVLLVDHSLWQSSNEGYSWTQLYPEEQFIRFYHHKYSSTRAYLLTNTETFYYTVDGARTWSPRTAPSLPNTFRAQVLRFHPEADKLIWTGNRDCKDFQQCHAEAQYSRNNGRTWTFLEKYVVNCAWAVDTKLATDGTEILCESYRDKTGSQMLFQMGQNPLTLVEGSRYFQKQKKIFNEVVGFAKASEFLVVAEVSAETRSLNLQISIDGVHFAPAQFPPNMKPETHAYTMLESSTASLFVHMTMSEPSLPYWGNILKSNSNGTYFGLSVENVNRDERGYVDFEKVVGLDGIVLINVVSNPDEAVLTGRKVLQSRITHNDGGTWKPLDPPTHDSNDNKYPCTTTHCALHIHGYTERLDPLATYSSSAVVGLILAVGNVGESLAPYDQCNTFLSRDGGFTWEEVHKDAHIWKVGDSGSVLVIANDEEPTNHILFSTDEGLSWREYKFSNDKLRVRSITTVPENTSRRFLLLGHPPHSSSHRAVFIDFTALTSRQCVINVDSPGHDDFELWSPSDERAERCLFGRQTVFHRRVRDRDCYVGVLPKANERIEKHCACGKADFECEFNYYKNAEDECVLTPGTSPLPSEELCQDDAEYWYERTAYRKIAFSSCEDGERLDRGPRHSCLRSNSHTGFWFFVLLAAVLAVAFVGYWYYAGIPPSVFRVLGHIQRMFDSFWPWARRERGYETVPMSENPNLLDHAI